MLIKINGMSCNNCKKSVEEAIKNVKGVKKYNVSLEDGCAEVEGDFNITELKQAIENIGFDAE
ncbi:MAG: heavy metal-associated domain-containing protein [Ezakiella sp.]|uniref:heavy-metal-associated domain-containing protein n=1 Tax=Ezakiella sp. TaxID=1935205 RepID=UPI0029757B8C|nr:heavy metal-associated domain-containing protein [Ezakiella sp.]MDD7730637.1 heavy metal-associated domain-containing protein [Eubacteriales bacterium]MDY6080129.1 heavy metal-associated domain-containing protein [Ezakiella sp.]